MDGVTGVQIDDAAVLNGPRGESWAYVADGNVHYGGVEDLWALAERAYTDWDNSGRPSKETWTLKVDSNGRMTVQLP